MQFRVDQLLIVGTLDGGTVQGAELCNAIRRHRGSCPGMRLPEAASRKGLPLQSLRSDNIISNTIWRSFALGKQAEGLRRASLELSCVIWASDRFQVRGVPARREVSALSKAYFPPSFQALTLTPPWLCLQRLASLPTWGQLEIPSYHDAQVTSRTATPRRHQLVLDQPTLTGSGPLGKNLATVRNTTSCPNFLEEF